MEDSMYKIYSALGLKENEIRVKEGSDAVSLSVAFKDLSLADV
jgi:hypothetical protein